MAKKGMIEQNNRRIKLVAKYAAKRAALKAITKNADAPMEERNFRATARRYVSAIAAR